MNLKDGELIHDSALMDGPREDFASPVFAVMLGSFETTPLRNRSKDTIRRIAQLGSGVTLCAYIFVANLGKTFPPVPGSMNLRTFDIGEFSLAIYFNFCMCPMLNLNVVAFGATVPQKINGKETSERMIDRAKPLEDGEFSSLIEKIRSAMASQMATLITQLPGIDDPTQYLPQLAFYSVEPP